MAHEVNCPTCKHTLRIPTGASGRWVTCPRCLASVANPNVLHSDSAVLAESGIHPRSEREALAVPPREPEPRQPRGDDCPWCGHAIQRSWRVCPHCEAPLRNSSRSHPLPSVDEEVEVDSKGVGLGLIALGLVGGVGILLLVCGGGASIVGWGSTRQTVGVAFVIGIVLLCLVVVGMSLSATSQETARRVTGMMLGGVAVALLAVVLVLTAFIYSVASCLEPCQGKTSPPGTSPPAQKPQGR